MTTSPWTHTKDVERFLTTFVESSKASAVVLAGNWGAGKTYLWRQIVSASNHESAYAYVSLFGLATVEDLRHQIFQELTSNEAGGGWSPAAVVKQLKNSRTAKKWSRLAEQIPGIQAYGGVYREIAFSSVKDALICLDDLERRSDGLALKDILGLISFLKESRNCKILVILNEDELGEARREYQRLEEKVFDTRVTLNPPPRHAVTCALGAHDPQLDAWIKHAEALNLNNIRVIQRARRYVDNVHEVVRGEIQKAIAAQIVASCVLLTACKFHTNESIPSIEFVKRYGIGLSKGLAEADKHEAGWADTLRRYRWSSTDELDLELSMLVENGYPSADRLNAEIDRKNRTLADAHSEEQLAAAWRPFHDSLTTDADKFLTDLELAYRTNIGHVTPLNLDAAARMLRELGHPSRADDLIERYIEANRGTSNLDLDGYAFGDELKDARFLARLEDVARDIPEHKDLAEVLTRIGRDQGWGSSDKGFLLARTVDDYEALFRTHQGKDLSQMIKAALTFGSAANASEDDKKISSAARSALLRIAAEDPFRARQIRKYGVEIPPT